MEKRWLVMFMFLCSFAARAQRGNTRADLAELSRYGRQTAGIAAVTGVGGKGVGLQYEYMLSPALRTSCFLQTSFCWSVARQAYFYPNGSYVQGHDRYPLLISFQPGFRYYPRGSIAPVKYIFEGSFLFAFGKGTSFSFDNNTDNLRSRQVLGILFGNGIGIQIRHHFRILLTCSGGICSDDGYDATYAPFTDIILLGRATLAFGYRY